MIGGSNVLAARMRSVRTGSGRELDAASVLGTGAIYITGRVTNNMEMTRRPEEARRRCEPPPLRYCLHLHQECNLVDANVM